MGLSTNPSILLGSIPTSASLHRCPFYQVRCKIFAGEYFAFWWIGRPLCEGLKVHVYLFN